MFTTLQPRRLATAFIALAAFSCASRAAVSPALEADAFVASTGVATHWRFQNVYSQYPALSDLLIDSGIRHCRDSGAGPDFMAKLRKLGGAGVKSVVTVNPSAGLRPDPTYWANSPAYSVNDYVRLVGANVVAFVEMNNELDMPSQQAATYWRNTGEPISDSASSPYYYVSYLQAATADADARLAGDADPAIRSTPLIGPPLTTDAAYSAVGDRSADIDYSNIHHYYYGWNPETTNVRGIAHAIAYQSSVQGPGRGRAATEGGEATAAGVSGDWPEFAQGRYLPRYYLAHFLNGFTLTTAYEFIDEGADTANKEKNYGLLKNDLTPKAGYLAVKNLLSLLKDPGPAFAPGSLDYTLSGSTANVWSALLRKRNGDYYLCLWLGLPCYSPSTDANITVPAQSVTLTVPSAIAGARLFTLDDTGAMSASAATLSGGSLGLSLTDRVTVVRLSTASSGGAASAPAGLRALPDNGQVTVKWAPVFEASTYTVKRASSANGAFTNVASGLTATSWTDTGRANGTACYYRVVAVNAGGTSGDSATVSAVPAAPVILDNAAASGVTLTGTWTPSTSTAGYYGSNFLHDGNTGATGGRSVRFAPALATAGTYDVYLHWTATANRATNAPVDVIHSAGTATLSLNQQLNHDSWVLLGTFPFATGSGGSVLVRNDGANGYVVADAVKFVLSNPLAPSGLVATPGSGQIGLAWSAAAGATGYHVKRAPGPGGPFTFLASNTSATTFTDTGVVPNTPCYYVVSALNAGGESMDGAPVRAVLNEEFVVDNADASGVVKTGAWTSSATTSGYYGANYLHDANTGATGGKKVTFTPTLPITGNYEVYVRWTSETNRADNAPIDVVHASGTTSFTVNQRADNGVWISLGVFSFAAGTGGKVVVRNDGANGYVVADAVRFVHQ